MRAAQRGLSGFDDADSPCARRAATARACSSAGRSANGCGALRLLEVLREIFHHVADLVRMRGIPAVRVEPVEHASEDGDGGEANVVEKDDPPARVLDLPAKAVGHRGAVAVGHVLGLDAPQHELEVARSQGAAPPRVERAIRRAEERGALADDPLDRSRAVVDLCQRLRVRERSQDLVVARVVADEVPRRGDLAGDRTRGDRAIVVAVEVAADPEERGPHLVAREKLEDRGGGLGERSVVEGEGDDAATVAGGVRGPLGEHPRAAGGLVGVQAGERRGVRELRRVDDRREMLRGERSASLRPGARREDPRRRGVAQTTREGLDRARVTDVGLPEADPRPGDERAEDEESAGSEPEHAFRAW